MARTPRSCIIPCHGNFRHNDSQGGPFAEMQPPEPTIISPPGTANNASETAAHFPAATATAGPATTAQQFIDNAGPLKRQRRPSVRLGDIGDQPATLAYDSHARRPTKHPWRLPKDSSSTPSSKAVKARSLTNLVNGAGVSQEGQEFEYMNNHNGNGNAELGFRKAKAKRGTATKRVRSSWVTASRVVEGAEVDSREDEDEGFRDFDPDPNSPLKDPSPVHSVDNVELGSWQGQRRPTGRHVVSETREDDDVEFDQLPESDLRDLRDRKCGTSEGVRSWLVELGLSRYAPIFEIHEVDDEVLPMLTFEDLKDMGINAVGSRRKMHTAIQKLREGCSQTSFYRKLVQEEIILKKHVSHSLNLVGQGAGKALKPKANKFKKGKTPVNAPNVERKDQKASKCHFCWKDGHFQKDCLKRKAWWLDSGATTHVCNMMQGFLTIQTINPNESFLSMGNRMKASIEGIGTY
ncbi:transcription initiation factor TFIID subunit 11-like [Senna tora]|uniref:Transcription initiation factor TFIID subunit 11-like n=1 Tax=Senna tora TaxID=362788 RepID=A0A834X6I8_9FABA|nr:transcription initiation factor TFIID subunit 11-like [Senna tora]